MPNTILVLRRMNEALSQSIGQFANCRKELLFLCGSGISLSAAILFELIMQGFQADSENFCSPGLVVACRLQCLQNEEPLSLFHGRAHAEADCVGIIGGGMRAHVS